MKTKWLLLILLFAVIIRLYHINYPVIGYHNWKETHYLTEARNFARYGFFKYGFFIPAYDYPNIDGDPSGAHADTFPSISILGAFIYKIFGENLAMLRLISVALFVGSLYYFYLFLNLFTKNDTYITIATILYAFNPMTWFFGRQFDLINVSLFCMIGGAYYMIRWLETQKQGESIIGSIMLCICLLTKYSFALVLIPISVLYLTRKWDWKQLIVPFFIFCLIIPFHLYTRTIHTGNTISDINTEITKIDITVFTSNTFWYLIGQFINDNFTDIGFMFALLGAFIICKRIYKNQLSDFTIFIFYYIVGSLVWFIIMAYKIQGHSYHMYPLLPLVICLMAGGLLFLSGFASEILKIKAEVILIAFIGMLFFISYSSAARMFDTQFIGLDIAGDYIKNDPHNVFFPSYQSYGVLWHGDVKGYPYVDDNATMLKLEQDRDVKYFFMYEWGIDSVYKSPSLQAYLYNNYNMVQYVKVNNNIIYYLLKKGPIYSNNLTIKGYRWYDTTIGRIRAEIYE